MPTGGRRAGSVLVNACARRLLQLPETTLAPTGAPPRPTLRCWTHLATVPVAIAGAIVLVILGGGNLARQISLAVYGVCLVLLFSVSASYHRGPWSPRTRRVWGRLDHATIFLAIAGTYTPVVVNVLQGWPSIGFAERTGTAREAAEGALSGAMDRARERVAHGRSRLRLLSPAALVERGYLRLDDMSNRLASALGSSIQDRVHRLSGAASRLERASPETRVLLYRQRLGSLGKRIQGASPGSVLNRGFAIVRDDRGRPVIRRAAIRPGQRLEAEFADGRAPLRAEES